MEQQSLIATRSSYRSAGWAAITSGVFGVAAYGFLWTAVNTRMSWIPSSGVYFMFHAHDFALALQLLFLIAVAFGLQQLSHQSPPGMSKATRNTGVGLIVFAILCLLLGLGKVVSDGFYMLPQALLGLWLIVANRRFSELLPRWLTWFGTIVGFGLTLVGVSWLGLSFVYPTLWAIPAVPIQDVTQVESPANNLFHQTLNIGTYIGVITLPVWTIVTGFKLLKEQQRLTGIQGHKNYSAELS
jgi:hypothetical protein